MRKQYDSLAALVTQEMRCDLLSGDLYLFTNRNRTRAKVLMFDGTGLCIFQKRLEQGRFARLWRSRAENSLQMTGSELALFLEGSTLAGVLRLSPPPLSAEAFTPFPMRSAEYRDTLAERRPSRCAPADGATA